MVMQSCKKAMKSHWLDFPDSHARLDPSFRNGEVFDRNLLDLRIVEEEIVVKSDSIAGKRLSGACLNTVVSLTA